MEIYQVQQQWDPKKGFFGRGGRQYVDVVTPIGRGWILGEFKWNQNYGDLTALLDLSPGDSMFIGLSFYLSNNGTLVQVQPYSEGFKAFLEVRYQLEAGYYIVAMQTVKRLTGKAS